MGEIPSLLAICGVLAAIGAWLLATWRRGWSSRKVALIAALPFPAVFAALCLFVLVRASLAPKEACGVDACAMAMAFALIALFWTALGYGIGVGMAALVVRKRRA
jgi:hypothetical protein